MARTRAARPPVADAAEPEEYDYSRGKQDFGRRAESFFGWLKGYPEKSNLNVVVYRKWPVIDRQQAGFKNNSIEKVAAVDEFSREYLARAHGNGKYMVYASDPTLKECTERARVEVKVDEPDNAPILNPHELVLGDDSNTAYVNSLLRQGVLTVDASGRISVKGKAAEVTDAPPAAAAAGDGGLADVVLKLVDRVTAPAPAPAPAAADKVFDVAFQLAERMTPKETLANDLVKALIPRLVAQPAPAPAAATIDPLEAYERVARIIDKRGGSGAASDSPWGAFLSGLGDFLREAPTMIATFAALRGAAGGAAPALAEQPIRNYGAAASDLDEEEMVTMTKAQAFAALQQPEMAARIQAVSQRAIESCLAGKDGEQFAAGLLNYELDGPQIYAVLSALGVDTLLQFIAAQPALAEHQERIGAFLRSFLAYGAAA